MTKSEMLFYYESRQNPNGDPDAENQPRLMHDQTIMVTDVRIKRTIRDYAKQKMGYTLFVDYGEDGSPTTADKRAKEISKKSKSKGEDYIKIMLNNTFDVPLFGGLVTMRGKGESSQKLTGPVQFSIGRSINPVNIIQPTITSRFTGDESKGRHTTIGRFYSVEYALIKITGAINPSNLAEYQEEKEIVAKFEKHRDELPSILWEGTNQLVTRSKYPQNAVLFIQVDYKDSMYNDLGSLVKENEQLQKENVKEMCKSPFNFANLVKTLNARKSHVEKIRIKCVDELNEDVDDMVSQLKGIKIEKI